MEKGRILKKLLSFQQNELTEYLIYKKLVSVTKNKANREVLEKIAQEEYKHYNFFKEQTRQDVKPRKLDLIKYYLIARIFGLTFGLKLMEQGESEAQENYEEVAEALPEIREIIKDEEKHERDILRLLDEERLKYVGSVVLGLNDALVELTGALAGLTLALRDIKLIAVAGLVTGIAASFSMAASEYLSTKSEGGKDAVKASIYTGVAYLGTVLLLIAPYLILSNPYLCLAIALCNAIVVILIFTFYVSVAQEKNFAKRFTEMAAISLGVAGLSFVMGYVIRIFFNI